MGFFRFKKVFIGMRRFDKKYNLANANLLAEQRYLANKGLLTEDITIPIKVGDTILGGKFLNKKIVVKKIGKNAKGDLTINGKPLLRFRILKDKDKEE